MLLFQQVNIYIIDIEYAVKTIFSPKKARIFFIIHVYYLSYR